MANRVTAASVNALAVHNHNIVQQQIQTLNQAVSQLQERLHTQSQLIQAAGILVILLIFAGAVAVFGMQNQDAVSKGYHAVDQRNLQTRQIQEESWASTEETLIAVVIFSVIIVFGAFLYLHRKLQNVHEHIQGTSVKIVKNGGPNLYNDASTSTEDSGNLNNCASPSQPVMSEDTNKVRFLREMDERKPKTKSTTNTIKAGVNVGVAYVGVERSVTKVRSKSEPPKSKNKSQKA